VELERVVSGPFRWPEDFDETDIADAVYRQQQEQASDDARYAAEFDWCVANPVGMDDPLEEVEADGLACSQWDEEL
jgi:hypothetical protein